jgi:nitric oxide synthase-interacting protein
MVHIQLTYSDEGHIYCKECIYENILNQKREISREKKQQEMIEKDQDEEKKHREMEQKIEAIKKFEKDQDATLSFSLMKTNGVEAAEGVPGVSPAANKPAHFWNPQSGVAIEPGMKQRKAVPTCVYGHQISLKSLHPVQFEVVENERVCPLCKDTLSNNMTLHKYSCGHVVCEECFNGTVPEIATALIRSCGICSKEGPIMRIASEGTSFAGKGKVLASKFEIAFQ